MGVEERRNQLVGVALDLFGRRSPEDVSIDEIAAAAGISRPLVYHYFPGKQGLYAAALRHGADELVTLFEEPYEGPLGARLLRVVRRFFDFADRHGTGFAALMRGSSSVAEVLVAEVRQAAYERLLTHLGAGPAPSPRLRFLVRSWVSLAESTAVQWLDGRLLPRDELASRLVHDFAALAAVSAAYDDEVAALLTRAFADEWADGPFGDLADRLGRLGLTAGV